MPNRKIKQGPERYLKSEFIRELRRKGVEYYIGADQYRSSAGKRFPKRITQKPLFQAIAYVRRRGLAERKLERDFAPAEDQEFQRFSIRRFFAANELNPKGLIDMLDELFGPPEPAHATLSDACIIAVRGADIGRLKDIVKFCELFERKYQRTRKEQSDSSPLEYYAAMAALGSLVTKKTIPTKTQVREAAWKEQAIAELPVMHRVGSKKLLPQLQEAEEPQEMRIDPEPVPDPELDQTQDVLRQQLKDIDPDPSDHYGADQDEPEYNPASNTPAEEKKPTLRQQRAKLIADRVEELRRAYTSSTWRYKWRRVFKNLELGDLPR
jgi:hypothetical protein